MTNEGDKHI